MAKIKVKISSFLIIVCLVIMGTLSVTPNTMAGKNPSHINPLPSENGYQHDKWMSFHDGVDDYIEWWYFKLTKVEIGEDTNVNFFFAYIIVNPDDRNSLKENTGTYVFTGMLYDEDTEDNGNGDKVLAVDRYGILDFRAEKPYLDVEIDDDPINSINYATTTDLPLPGDTVHLVGDIRPTATASGTLDGEPFILQDWSWDLTFTRNVGWTAQYNNNYAFLWEIYMMDAEVELSGTVTVNGHVYNVDNDWVGYQDHNWGQPFPREWMWGGASFSTDGNIHDSEMSFVLGGGVMGILPYGNLRGFSLALSDESDFYEWSTEQGDIVSYAFDDWYWYQENGNSWQVPKYYTVTAMDLASESDRYRADVKLYARDDIMLRLPIPKQDSIGVFNDFEGLGVPAEIILSQWVDSSSEWIEIKSWSHDDPSMVQLWGGAEYGIDSVLPDLIIEDIWIPDPGLLPGPVSASVKNQGTNSVTDFYVTFYDSGFSGIGSEIYLAVMTPLTPQHVIITLDPEESTTVTTMWTSPPYGGGGSGDILWVFADKYDTLSDPQEIEDKLSDRVNELEENNNGLGYDPVNDKIIILMSDIIAPSVGKDFDFLVTNPTTSTKTISLTLDQLTEPSGWDIGLYDSLDNPLTDVVLDSSENSLVTLKITPSIITQDDYYVKITADWLNKPTDNLSGDFIIVHLTTT